MRIFTAEFYAISLAIKVVYRGKEKDFIIFSDSMSSTIAVRRFQIEYDLVHKIIKDYTGLTNSSKRIVLCWIRSHVNIPGNERADAGSLLIQIQNFQPVTSHLVSRFCLKQWQNSRNKCVKNKLHSIYPTGTALHSKTLSRREAVILNRLHIGHSRLTHSYLLSGNNQPTCRHCGIPLTVKHILVKCPNLQDIRQKHFSAASLADLLQC